MWGMSAVANPKIPTSSFQNQTQQPTGTSYRGKCRKCGIAAVLQDSANCEKSAGSKRKQAECANPVQYTAICAPRGDPEKGARKRIMNTAILGDGPTSMHELMKDHTCTSLMENTTSNLAGYIQRNAEFETQKALAMSVMATALTKWRYGKACECAADSTKRPSVCGQPPSSHSTTLV